MIKGFVMASHHSAYHNFLRRHELNRQEWKYIAHLEQLWGYAPGARLPLFILEGFAHNYTVGDMRDMYRSIYPERVEPIYLDELEAFPFPLEDRPMLTLEDFKSWN